jgi:lincosamide nucleotidyltransferase A/C/D/E
MMPATTSCDVTEFYHHMEVLGIKIWIDGGWGVDALLGKQTRTHADLDIVV